MSTWGGVVRMLLAMGLLAVLPAAGAQTVEYFHTDALGTPVAVSNASGSVIERSEYAPYGELLNRPATDGPGFTGHVQDTATGMVNMQQRYYDPMIGRFLSVDPVTADSATGANFNRYWYANNNPYKFTDPDGRASCALGREYICRFGVDSSASAEDNTTTLPVTTVRPDYPGASGCWDCGASGSWDYPEVPTEGVEPFFPEFDLLPFLKISKGAILLPIIFRAEGRGAIEVIPHALRRFGEAEGKNVSEAIAKRISSSPIRPPGTVIQETIKLEGKEYSYRAFVKGDGTVQVGSAVEGQFGRNVAEP